MSPKGKYTSESYVPFMTRWLNAKLSISLPEDEYARIKKHSEIKWGAVARKAVIQYVNELEKSKELLEQSKQQPDNEKKQKAI